MRQSSWIGRTIGGRYQITELLGQGGMSAVYKASDPNLRRVVAIKLIHSHLSNEPQFVHRFKDEAAAVASLRHPNIVQVYDFNNDDDVYFIVFEFVPGESLQQYQTRVVNAGPVPFALYSVGSRPAGANTMCALVANVDHSVQLGTGNCFALP